MHSWYLRPESVALSIFDDNDPAEVKANMAQFMRRQRNVKKRKNKNINWRGNICNEMIYLPLKHHVSSFVTPGTKKHTSRDFLSAPTFLKREIPARIILVTKMNLETLRQHLLRMNLKIEVSNSLRITIIFSTKLNLRKNLIYRALAKTFKHNQVPVMQ